MIIFAPIKNFDCGVDSIDLGNLLSIVKFSEKEVSELEENFEQPHSSVKREEFEKVANFFHLRRRFEEKELTSALDGTSGIFDNVIDALRVFQKGIVWFDLVYSVNPIGKSERFPKPIYSSYPLDRLGDWNYNLSKENALAFKGFWKEFSKATKENFVERAVRRFSQSSEKHVVSDQLVDYFISFEVLFSDGEGITDKIARRTAVLLKKDRGSRIETYSDMKKGYGQRSNIVHGRRIEHKKIWECSQVTEKYLRNCLRKIIKEKRYNRKDLIEYLDFGNCSKETNQ